MATLTKKNVTKFGIRYELPNVKASVMIPLTMFADPENAPEKIEIVEPTEPVMDPSNGQPLLGDDQQPIVRGTVFATENRKRTTVGTTSGAKVNAVLQAAREEAKKLRDKSKEVLKTARQQIKAGKKAAPAQEAQPALVE